MSDINTPIQQLKEKVKQFTKERDWHTFHSPQRICIYLSVEAAELLEHFIWHDGEDAKKRLERKRSEIEDEVADVAYWLLQLCWQHDIDLTTALEKKLEKNARNYPIEKCKGSNRKYTEL